MSKRGGEGIEQDLLGMAVKIEGSAGFGKSASGSDGDPIGGFVTGAGEAFGIDKSFQKRERVAVAKSPVPGNPSSDETEDMGREMGHADPGENEKTGIVCDEREVPLAKGRGPADGEITGLEFPDGGAPSECGQQTPVGGGDKVFDPLPNEGTKREVMIRTDQPVPEFLLFRCGDKRNGKGLMVSENPRDGRCVKNHPFARTHGSNDRRVITVRFQLYRRHSKLPERILLVSGMECIRRSR